MAPPDANVPARTVRRRFLVEAALLGASLGVLVTGIVLALRVGSIYLPAEKGVAFGPVVTGLISFVFVAIVGLRYARRDTIRERTAHAPDSPQRIVRASMFGLIAIVAVAVTLVSWAQSRIVARARGDAAMINTAGRQRMLSQRVSRSVLSTARGTRDAVLDSVLAQMQSEQRGLIAVVDTLNAGGRTSLGDVRLALHADSGARAEFIALAQRIPVDSSMSSEGLGHLSRLSDSVLSHADIVVRALQRASETDADAAEYALNVVTVLLMLALIAAAALILEPVARLVERQYDVGEERRRELEQVSIATQRTGVAAILSDTDLRITWVNDAFTRLTGFLPDQAIGRVFTELLHAQAETAQKIRSQLAADDGVRGFSGEVHNCRKDGTCFVGFVDIQPLYSDDGAVRGYVKFVSDATLQVVERDTLAGIFETVTDGIVLYDATGSRIRWNPAASRILGLTADQLRGDVLPDPGWSMIKRDGSIITREDTAPQFTRRTGEPVKDLIHGIRSANGSVRWISVSTHAIRNASGNVESVIASFRDVTDVLLDAQRAELVVDAAGLGTWEVHLSTGAAIYNSRLAGMLGYTLGEFPPDVATWIAKLHPDERDELLGKFDAHVQGRSVEYHHEHRMLRKDGSWAWVMCVGRVTERDAHGAAVRIAGINMDISAMRALEERADAVQDRLQIAIDGSSEGLWDWSVDSGELWLSPRALEFFRAANATDGDGTSAQDFAASIHPDDRDEARRTIRDVMARQVDGDFEARILGRDASYQWFRIRCKARRDARDRTIRVAGSVQEISEQKAAAERLRLATASLEEAQVLAHTGSWSYDLATGAILWSRQIYALFGRDEAHGPPAFEAAMTDYAAADTMRLRAAVVQAAATGTPYDIVLRTSSANAEVQFVRARGEARRAADGTVTALVGTATDVTQDILRERDLEAAMAMANVMAERADAANIAKSEFLANMSHEIRTPLTAILGFADVMTDALADADVAPRARAAAATIQRAGKHLLTVINDILDLSRIEAGKLSIVPVQTDLISLLLEVDSMMRSRTAANGVELHTTLGTAVPENVICDATRVRQILINLVGNAAKFTHQGSVTLRVAALPAGAPSMLRLEIEDTGIGLSAELARRLFAPFSQADASVTRQYGGTGLGLVISRRLAELMGGSVRLDYSTPGMGSRFVVELPVQVAPGTEFTRALRVRQATAAPRHDDPVLEGRILLAEDGEDNQRLIAHFLTRGGAHVTTAATGIDALAAWRDALSRGVPFDLLVSDMQMPEMDGYSLARQLRADGVTVPIIALTAHAMAEDRQLCLDAGCSDYTTKPIDRRELITLAAKWLGIGRESPRAAIVTVPAFASGSSERHLAPPAVVPAREPLVSTLANDPSMTALIAMFVAQLPPRVEALEAASRAGDRVTMAGLAHQLKGAAGGYGFPTITETARALERFASAGGKDDECQTALCRLRWQCSQATAGLAFA